MPHPQDVAVPSLPEREIVLPCRPASAFFHRFKDGKCAALERLQQAQERREDGWQGHWRPVYVGDALDAYARAAVIADRAAGRASAEPEGFVLVPREPTQAMLAAAQGVFGHPLSKLSYRDMLAAAPTPTASIAPKAEGRDFPMLRFPELYGVPPKADPLSASVESRLAECASKPFESEGNRRVVPKAEGEAAIDMVLHCPACGMQHIDAPESMAPKDQPQLNAEWGAWANPPHRSHLCHGCGHVWRPADVPTNGVAAVKTTGKADSPIAAAVAQAAAGANRAPGSEENRPVIPRSKCALYGGSCNCDPDTVYCPVHNRIAIIAPLETPTVSDRSRFEAHMRPFGYSLARDGAGDYADPEVRGSWSIWRAALSPRPEADADRASGGGVDTERLNWLLANPNTVLEDAGNEWFILDADSEPTYFKSGREAIDAARATPTTKD